MTVETKVVSSESPLKLMIGDLKRVIGSQSQSYPWRIRCQADSSNSRSAVIEFAQIWLQGSVINSSNDNETVVLTDGSGEVRVTKCTRVPGDCSWITTGAYCGIFACIKRLSASTPEVEAIKVMDLSLIKDAAEKMWPFETQELSSFIVGNIAFKT